MDSRCIAIRQRGGGKGVTRRRTPRPIDRPTDKQTTDARIDRQSQTGRQAGRQTGARHAALMSSRLGRMVGHATDNLAMLADDYEAAVRRAAHVYVTKRKSGSRGAAAGAGTQGTQSKHRRLASGPTPWWGSCPGSASDEDEDARGASNASGRTSSPDAASTSAAGSAAGPGPDEIMDRFLYGVLPEHPRVYVSASDLVASLAAARSALEGAAPPERGSGGSAKGGGGGCRIGGEGGGGEGKAALGEEAARSRGALRQLSAADSQVSSAHAHTHTPTHTRTRAHNHAYTCDCLRRG